MAGQSAKMGPVLRGEISNTQSRPLNGHPPSIVLGEIKIDALYLLLRSSQTQHVHMRDDTVCVSTAVSVMSVVQS